jgi:general secretion pathway protein I
MPNRNSQRGFTLIEVLLATTILAIAVSALLSNLSTSTSNLMRVNDADRLTFFTKRKMDELITVQNFPRGTFIEGVFEFDNQRRPVCGWRARILPFGPPAPNGIERLERVELETWLQRGARRRTLFVESFRRWGSGR